jgi:ion channel
VQIRLGPILKKVVLGPEDPNREKRYQGSKRTYELLKEEWEKPTFGMLRLVRLFLMTISFLSPIIVIDDVIGNPDLAVVTISRELYYCVRASLLAVFLFHGEAYKLNVVIFAVSYFVFDILSHLAGQIFVWGKYSVDPRRSLLLSLMNYFEVILAFAIFYLHWDALAWAGKATATKALYFSLVTGTTVGYGDVIPNGPCGEKIVMVQLSIFLLFAVLFISTFISRMPAETRSDTNNLSPK